MKKILVLMLLSIAIASLHAAESGAKALSDFGDEVNGLRAKVSLVKTQTPVGQPIQIHYVKHNVSDVNQIIWHSGFWPNHQIVVKDALGKSVARTARGNQCAAAFSPGGARDKNFPMTLKPGDEDATEGAMDLTQQFDLNKLGTYSVQIFYEEMQKGWNGRLASNIAQFQIVK